MRHFATVNSESVARGTADYIIFMDRLSFRPMQKEESVFVIYVASRPRALATSVEGKESGIPDPSQVEHIVVLSG